MDSKGCGCIGLVVLVAGVLIFGYIRGGQRMEAANVEATAMAPIRPVQAVSLAFQPDSFSGPDIESGKFLVSLQAIHNADIYFKFSAGGALDLLLPLPAGISSDDPLSLISGDSLQIPVQAAVNSSALPGEYIVLVEAIHANDSSAAFAEDSMKLYVAYKNQRPFFLLTPEAFSDYLQELSSEWLTLPASRYKVAIQLEEGNFPQRGQILIHAQGIPQATLPEIGLRVGSSSGIRFGEFENAQLNENRTAVTFQPGKIHGGESRVIRVPFVINPDSLVGRYAIELSVRGEVELEDRLPIAVQLEHSTLNEPAKWLVLEPLN